MAPARARACVACDAHLGVRLSGLVFWAPSTTRVSVSAARATTPRLRCSDASLQCGARRGRCVRVTASTRRARAPRNHSNVSTAPRAHNPPSDSAQRLGTPAATALRQPQSNLCVCAICRVHYAQLRRRRGCRCVLVRQQTLAQLFLPQPATGVSAHQRFISTTASKPLVPRIPALRRGQALSEMPLASH